MLIKSYGHLIGILHTAEDILDFFKTTASDAIFLKQKYFTAIWLHCAKVLTIKVLTNIDMSLRRGDYVFTVLCICW